MDDSMHETMPQWATTILTQLNHLSNTVSAMQERERHGANPLAPSLSPEAGATGEDRAAPPMGKLTKHLGPLASYDGNREELEQWIFQAEAKLMVDCESCSETTRFFTVHNQLRGEASQQLQPWVRAVANTPTMTAQALIAQLRLLFGDPHRKEKAQRELHKIKQANRPFMECFTDYRRLVLEAGGSDWPDKIRKAYLEAGLSFELQQCMIGKARSVLSFKKYCNELKQASHQLDALNLCSKGKCHNPR